MAKNKGTPKYRLALDLGTTSIGWAVLRLNNDNPPRPTAIIRAGVRIFPDGRNPKDGSSLAVTRRMARSMRRRRDRLLKRKRRMMDMLVKHGLFPEDALLRKQYENLNPYELRSRGLHEELQPHEFARALFHINQRRGFKSNRKTDSKDNESGAMKTAISQTQHDMAQDNCRTVGEWLWQRMQNKEPVRARYRQKRETTSDGKTKINKSYDLYINRQMIADEFDLLWEKQASYNPSLYNEKARDELRDTLLFQRNLKPVKAGRCTLMPVSCPHGGHSFLGYQEEYLLAI